MSWGKIRRDSYRKGSIRAGVRRARGLLVDWHKRRRMRNGEVSAGQGMVMRKFMGYEDRTAVHFGWCKRHVNGSGVVMCWKFLRPVS